MKIHLTEELLKDLYLNQHLTLAQIASITGITRQAVHYHIRKYNIDASKAETFLTTCASCQKEFTIRRCRFNKTRKPFCSTTCYHAYLKTDYIYSSKVRNENRKARRIMEQHLSRPLLESEVVHHKDNDTSNNDLSNLLLFKNQSEHLKYYHKQRLEKLQYPYAE